jgi:hypothetical protein
MSARVCRALILLLPLLAGHHKTNTCQDLPNPATPRAVAADQLHKDTMHRKYLPLLTVQDQGTPRDSDQIQVTLVQDTYDAKYLLTNTCSTISLDAPFQTQIPITNSKGMSCQIQMHNKTRKLNCVEACK